MASYCLISILLGGQIEESSILPTRLKNPAIASPDTSKNIRERAIFGCRCSPKIARLSVKGLYEETSPKAHSMRITEDTFRYNIE